LQKKINKGEKNRPLLVNKIKTSRMGGPPAKTKGGKKKKKGWLNMG